MSRRNKLIAPPRSGMPGACIACEGPLHRNSEYYCSEECVGTMRETRNEDAPPFLSK